MPAERKRGDKTWFYRRRWRCYHEDRGTPETQGRSLELTQEQVAPPPFLCRWSF